MIFKIFLGRLLWKFRRYWYSQFGSWSKEILLKWWSTCNTI